MYHGPTDVDRDSDQSDEEAVCYRLIDFDGDDAAIHQISDVTAPDTRWMQSDTLVEIRR